MSQAATLQALDAELFAAFAGAGAADSGTHTPAAGGSATPCTFLVDRAAQFFDEATGVAGNRIVIGILVAQVATPARRDVIAIGAETFKLEQLLERDESLTRWVVVNG